MTRATLNRVLTTACGTIALECLYTCHNCGYRNVKLEDHYCPQCGHIISIFYTIKEK